MFKFFRNIRRNLLSEDERHENLLDQNQSDALTESAEKRKVKVGRYLKYAIGEIVLVVIGILIALSLNNLNEARKNGVVKSQLITDLILELQSSEKIINEAIALGDSLIANGQLYLKHIGSEDLAIPMDSLKKLGNFITDGIPYDLNLPIYEDSKSSGKLSMIKNKKVLELYAEIMAADIGGSIHRKISNDMFYTGSGWELRKEVGTSEIFTLTDEMLPANYRLTDKELWDIISRPSTYATFDNSLKMKVNRISYMNRIKKGMSEVIKLLRYEKNQ